MVEQQLLFEKKNEMAILTFNRASKRNALSYEMWKSIPEFIKEVEEDPAIKVLLIRGVIILLLLLEQTLANFKRCAVMLQELQFTMKPPLRLKKQLPRCVNLP